LSLVVAGWTDELSRTHHAAGQSRQEELALRHQQHAAVVALQRPPARRVNPAEAAAFDNGRVCRLTERMQIVVGERLRTLDGNRR
jgi:hypothetical protein